MRTTNYENRTISGSQMKKIVELTLSGESRKSIADEVDCSNDTVWRYQKKFGLL